MSAKDKIKKYEEAEQATSENRDAQAQDAGNKDAPASADEMTEKLNAALAESQQHYDRLLRVSAEFDNYKKRAARESEEFRKFANESLLKDLLHVLDNLERAIASASEGGAANQCVVEGVEMTLSEIMKTFSKYGVSVITALGEPFDPSFHQAVMQEETDAHPANTVINEMQKGYMLHDRLLRPAMVVVAKPAAVRDGGAPSETTTNSTE